MLRRMLRGVPYAPVWGGHFVLVLGFQADYEGEDDDEDDFQ